MFMVERQKDIIRKVNQTGRILVSIHSACGINDYDLLIMDNNVSEDFLTQIRELGVAVETVGLKEV